MGEVEQLRDGKTTKPAESVWTVGPNGLESACWEGKSIWIDDRSLKTS
jgi:hypothetical protein